MKDRPPPDRGVICFPAPWTTPAPGRTSSSSAARPHTTSPEATSASWTPAPTLLLLLFSSPRAHRNAPGEQGGIHQALEQGHKLPPRSAAAREEECVHPEQTEEEAPSLQQER